MDNTGAQLQFTAFKEFGGVAGNEGWRTAIGETGAAYHQPDQHWYLRKDAEPLPIDTINTLLNIACKYQAEIKVELVQPSNEPT